MTFTRAFSGAIIVLLVAGMLTLSFNVHPTDAYSSGTGGTHEFVFRQARNILRNDGYRAYADFLDSVDPYSGLTYLDIMVKGSNENDALYSARQHYMDPMSHKGLYILWYYKSAGRLAQERLKAAASYWRNGDYYNAMYNLGWATHMLQDVTVPHHAWTTFQYGHSAYEGWVDSNKHTYAVDSGGTYSFPSFPDLQYYAPKHYSWATATAYDWVDYNAHESVKYFLSVNYNTASYVTDSADPYVETIHPLPNSLETTWTVTAYQTSGMQLHFERIDTQNGSDFIRIYDKYDNLLDSYTGQYGDFWTPWYSSGDTLKIKVSTDISVQSWGYKIKEVKYYDTGEDLPGAVSVLLPQAQRTTAGFIKFFFDKMSTAYQNDGYVYKSTSTPAFVTPTTSERLEQFYPYSVWVFDVSPPAAFRFHL